MLKDHRKTSDLFKKRHENNVMNDLVYAVIANDGNGSEVEIWSDMGLAVSSAKYMSKTNKAVEVVSYHPPRKGFEWVAGEVVFVATDGRVDTEPPSRPGLRPFRMVHDDALLEVGTLVVWQSATGELLEARITVFHNPASMITVKEDKPDTRACQIWIENIKFILPRRANS